MDFAQKMAAAAGAIGAVAKDKTNSFHRYDYTSATAIQARVQRALSANGLYISGCSFAPEGELDGKRAVLRCTLTVSDGTGTATAEGFGAGEDKLDKAPMKAQTASYKYALCALFCIGMGDDPEADHEADKRANEAPRENGGGDDKAWFRKHVAPRLAQWQKDAAEVASDKVAMGILRGQVEAWASESGIRQRGEGLRAHVAKTLADMGVQVAV